MKNKKKKRWVRVAFGILVRGVRNFSSVGQSMNYICILEA